MNRTGPLLALPVLAMFIMIFVFWQTGDDLIFGLPTSVVALLVMIFLCFGFGLLYVYLRDRDESEEEGLR